MINASISGETTGGGLRNLPKLLNTHKPELVVIELGANDGLRGFPLPTIEKNLSELVALSQGAGAKVLILGNHIPPNYGQFYTNAFHALFDKVAKGFDAAVVPFMLDEVAIYPELMQDDGLHPKAEAQQSILENIWPNLKKLLNKG